MNITVQDILQVLVHHTVAVREGGLAAVVPRTGQEIRCEDVRSFMSRLVHKMLRLALTRIWLGGGGP